MLKNAVLAGIVAVAFGAAILMPRLMDESDQSSFLAALLGDRGPGQIDRLVVGGPL
jgi:hypothetical protein